MRERRFSASKLEATSDLKLTVKADGNGSKTTDGTADTDLLFGQNGDDTMGGPQGADRFRAGTDEATDFAPSQGDTRDEATEAP